MVETRETDTIPTTVQRDTREQRPWGFDDLPVETRDVTLSTGDYTVPAYCTHDPEFDTYRPHFAVERKSGQDFLTAITWERDRFERELRRAAEWQFPSRRRRDIVADTAPESWMHSKTGSASFTGRGDSHSVEPTLHRRLSFCRDTQTWCTLCIPAARPPQIGSAT